jgi:hypothetical protein
MGGGKAECLAVGGRSVQRVYMWEAANLLAIKARGTGLVMGSRCSCKQFVAIVMRVLEETEGRGRLSGRAYE